MNPTALRKRFRLHDEIEVAAVDIMIHSSMHIIDESGTYPFHQLISNIGGAMGLFLGLNILEILKCAEKGRS